MTKIGNKNIINIYKDVPKDNLLRNTNRSITTSDYLIAEYPLVETPIEGETYTITIWGELAASKSSFGVYNTTGTLQLTQVTKIRNGVYSASFTWKNIDSYNNVITPTKILIYTLYSSQSGVSSISKIKLEKGINRNPDPNSLIQPGKIIQRIYRGGPNNLLKNSENVIISAGSSIWRNVAVYFDTPFEIKAGEKLTISVGDIEVLAGSATKFTVHLFNGQQNDYYGTYGTDGVITKDKPYITLTATSNVIANSILLYAGVGGQASGISVKYSKVMCVKGTTPAPFWTPAPSEATEDSCVIYDRKPTSNLLGGTNSLNSLDRTLDVWKAPWEQGKWRVTQDSDGVVNIFDLQIGAIPPNSPAFMYNMSNGKVHISQDFIPITIGKTYTLSAYAEGDGVICLACGSHKKTILISHSHFKRYYYTFEISEEDLDGENSVNVYFGIDEGTCEFTAPKLEEEVNPYTKWGNAPSNILKGSKNGYNIPDAVYPEDTSCYTSRDSEGYLVYTMSVKNNSANRNYNRYRSIQYGILSEYFIEGETYTFSAEIKSNASGFIKCDSRTTLNANIKEILIPFESTNGEWKRVSKTVKMTGLDNNTASLIITQFPSGTPVGSYVSVRKVCLVKGEYKGYVPSASEMTNNVVKLTQSEYNSLSTKNPNTLYCIEEGNYIQKIYNSEVSKNILTNSDSLNCVTNYFIKSYNFTETPIEGETYTVTIWGKLGEGKQGFAVYDSTAIKQQISLSPISGVGEHVYTGTFKWREGSGTEYLRIYAPPSSVTGVFSTIRKIKLERGENSDPVYSLYNNSYRQVYQRCYIKGKLSSIPTEDREHSLQNSDGGLTVIPYNPDTLEFDMTIPYGESVKGASDSLFPSKIKEIKIVGKASGKSDCLCTHYQNCITLDVSKYDVSDATDLSYAFYANKMIETLDLRNWQTYHNTNLRAAFYLCSKLKNIYLNGWSTSNVTSMADLFCHCIELENLNLGSWDFGKATDCKDIFWDCPKLKNLIFGYNLRTDFRVHWNPLLTHDSILSIINGLATVSGSKTLTVAQATYELLTTDEIAIATNKGWTIVSV